MNTHRYVTPFSINLTYIISKETDLHDMNQAKINQHNAHSIDLKLRLWPTSIYRTLKYWHTLKDHMMRYWITHWIPTLLTIAYKCIKSLCCFFFLIKQNKNQKLAKSLYIPGANVWGSMNWSVSLIPTVSPP